MKIHRVVQMLGATTSTGRLADDMYDLNYKAYYSKAEDKYIPISHMDFQHLVRAFVKQNDEDVRTDTQEGKAKDLDKQVKHWKKKYDALRETYAILFDSAEVKDKLIQKLKKEINDVA